MKTLFVAMTLTALLTSQARAADPELSIDTKRLLAYGTLAVMAQSCKASLTPDQEARLNTGLQKSSQAQKELTEAEFTEAMKAVGTQVGQNKDQICAALTPDFVEASLTDAAAGN